MFSVKVAELSPFGLLLLPQCIFSICCFSYFSFFFRGEDLGSGCLCSWHYSLCLLLGSWLTTFWKRAVHSVNIMFSLYHICVVSLPF